MLRFGETTFGDRNASLQDCDDARPLLSKRSRFEVQMDNEKEIKFEGTNSYMTSISQFAERESPVQPIFGNSGNNASKGPSSMKIPDLVQALAMEGISLRWDQSLSCYEVLNGQLFEQKFNALRSVRGKRKELSVDRPFARMHTYFILLRGEKWAGTGSLFRPKGMEISHNALLRHSDMISSSTFDSPHFVPPADEGCPLLPATTTNPIMAEGMYDGSADASHPCQLEQSNEDLLFLSPVGIRDEASLTQVIYIYNFIRVTCLFENLIFAGIIIPRFQFICPTNVCQLLCYGATRSKHCRSK
jgi:hypothetical protein